MAADAGVLYMKRARERVSARAASDESISAMGATSARRGWGAGAPAQCQPWFIENAGGLDGDTEGRRDSTSFSDPLVTLNFCESTA